MNIEERNDNDEMHIEDRTDSPEDSSNYAAKEDNSDDAAEYASPEYGTHQGNVQ